MSALMTSLSNFFVRKPEAKPTRVTPKLAPKPATLSAQKINSFLENVGGEFRGM